jgi:hypothetical protein
MAYYVNGVKCDTPQEALALRRATQERPAAAHEPPALPDPRPGIPGHDSRCTCDRCESYRIPWHQ